VWNIISNETATRNKKNLAPSEFKLGKETIPLTQAAQVFDDYFLNTRDGLINLQPDFYPAIVLLEKALPDRFPKMINIPITDAEVKGTISSMKNKTSSGYDGITSTILKLSADYISKPLTVSFNKSLTICIHPDRLKYTEVQPHFKKGQKSQISNYRPISLLSGFSKIFELLIFCRLK
jgi:hypothetical protein